MVKIEIKWNLIGVLSSNIQGQFFPPLVGFIALSIASIDETIRGEFNKITSKAEASNNTI